MVTACETGHPQATALSTRRRIDVRVRQLAPAFTASFALNELRFVISGQGDEAGYARPRPADTSNNGLLSTRRVIVPPAPARSKAGNLPPFWSKDFKLATRSPRLCSLGLTRNRWIGWR